VHSFFYILKRFSFVPALPLVTLRHCLRATNQALHLTTGNSHTRFFMAASSFEMKPISGEKEAEGAKVWNYGKP
jgi:hypothetical protein